MNSQQAKSAVVGATVLTGVLASIRSLSQGHAPPLRTVLGTFVAGVMLAALSGPLPALAGGLAVLMGLTALLTIGADAFGALTKGLTA